MKTFRENIWANNEYNYQAAYGFVPNIHTYFHDDDEKRDCMVVVPGGGYCMCVPTEGEIVAKSFYDRGMNAVVLTYTTDITMSVPLEKQPLYDIGRTVRLVRKNAEDWNLTGRIFIVGFSAGGHVCGSLAVHFDDVPESNPIYADFSCRPDGVILSYPVITTGEFTHIYSVWALIGQNAPVEKMEYFSLEKNVKEDTPPCFIWQTQTDGLVPVENSYLFAMALRAKKVPFAHYVFPDGFHGLSVATLDFFKGKFGEPYTMEQVDRAVAAVKAGKGINVSQQRKAELEQQFPDKKETFSTENAPDPDFDQKVRLGEDVSKWVDLAMTWMKRI